MFELKPAPLEHGLAPLEHKAAPKQAFRCSSQPPPCSRSFFLTGFAVLSSPPAESKHRQGRNQIGCFNFEHSLEHGGAQKRFHFPLFCFAIARTTRIPNAAPQQSSSTSLMLFPRWEKICMVSSVQAAAAARKNAAEYRFALS